MQGDVALEALQSTQIEVRDANGRPVAGADVVRWHTTTDASDASALGMTNRDGTLAVALGGDSMLWAATASATSTFVQCTTETTVLTLEIADGARFGCRSGSELWLEMREPLVSPALRLSLDPDGIGEHAVPPGRYVLRDRKDRVGRSMAAVPGAVTWFTPDPLVRAEFVLVDASDGAPIEGSGCVTELVETDARGVTFVTRRVFVDRLVRGAVAFDVPSESTAVMCKIAFDVPGFEPLSVPLSIPLGEVRRRVELRRRPGSTITLDLLADRDASFTIGVIDERTPRAAAQRVQVAAGCGRVTTRTPLESLALELHGFRFAPEPSRTTRHVDRIVVDLRGLLGAIEVEQAPPDLALRAGPLAGIALLPGEACGDTVMEWTAVPAGEHRLGAERLWRAVGDDACVAVSVSAGRVTRLTWQPGTDIRGQVPVSAGDYRKLRVAPLAPTSPDWSRAAMSLASPLDSRWTYAIPEYRGVDGLVVLMLQGTRWEPIYAGPIERIGELAPPRDVRIDAALAPQTWAGGSAELFVDDLLGRHLVTTESRMTRRIEIDASGQLVLKDVPRTVRGITLRNQDLEEVRGVVDRDVLVGRTASPGR